MTPGTELSSCALTRLSHSRRGYCEGMPFIQQEIERCIDAYEAGIRVATEVQLSVARVIDVEPVRAFVAGCADLTRDIGATQVSSARWYLDP